MIRKECLKSMAEESKKLLIMKNCMLSIKLTCILHTFLRFFFACAQALGKCMKVLVAFLKFLAPKTYKSIYNMYFAHIFAIFLRVHGLWMSVRKF